MGAFVCEMGLRSKEPRCSCVTGIESGESSADRTDVKALRPATSVDSGAWNARFREGIMLGVKRRTVGFGPSVADDGEPLW